MDNHCSTCFNYCLVSLFSIAILFRSSKCTEDLSDTYLFIKWFQCEVPKFNSMIISKLFTLLLRDNLLCLMNTIISLTSSFLCIKNITHLNLENSSTTTNDCFLLARLCIRNSQKRSIWSIERGASIQDYCLDLKDALCCFPSSHVE